MKLSIIVCTKNRAHRIGECLASIEASLTKAAPVDAEIVVVDNGSTDDTPSVIGAFASACAFPVRLLSEPIQGVSRAHNCALRAARGELLAFTDDDCRLSPDYVTQLLAYDAADTGLVLRGGRIELGDPTDLPLTINTTPIRMRWSRQENSARAGSLSGQIHGCNMAMRRELVDRVGPYHEDFGPGVSIAAGEDTDYLYRAYLVGATLEYVPDMTIFHHHGRKTKAEGQKLFREYMIANGALCARYIFKHPALCLPFYWDCKNALRELLTGANTFMPEMDFSHKDKVACSVRGAVRYWRLPRRPTARKPLDRAVAPVSINSRREAE